MISQKLSSLINNDKIIKTILGIHIVVLILESFYNFDPNDNMYVTSLVNPSISYDTNGFVQMPYYFILKLLNFLPIDFYLILKISSIVFTFLMFYFLSTFELIKNKLIFWIIVTIGYFNFISGQEIGSYTYTYIFLALSFLAFSNNKYLLTGIFYSIALGFKLSSLIFIVPILVFTFLENRKKIPITLAGVVLGALPILFFTQSKYFIFNNFTFHSLLTNTSRGIYYDYTCFSCHIQTGIKGLKLFFLNPHNLSFVMLILVALVYQFIQKKQNNQKISKIISFLILIGISFSVLLIAKAIYKQYLIPFSIVISFWIYTVFEKKSLSKYSILLALLVLSIGIRSYSIYDKYQDNSDILTVFNLRKEISNKIKNSELTPGIYTVSGALTADITSLKKYHDSSVFYPNVGDNLEDLNLKEGLSEYYQISIYPHEHLDKLPKSYIFGLNKGQFETMFKNRIKREFAVDSIHLGYYKNGAVYAIKRK